MTRIRRMGFYHVLHCIALITTILVFEIIGGGIHNPWFVVPENIAKDPWQTYGWFALVLYSCRYVTLIVLPQTLFGFFGLFAFDAFPGEPKQKQDVSLLPNPFICFRTVTRGDYPELVQNNVNRNIQTCLDAGLKNFVIEVVTDKSIVLLPHVYSREVVVPKDFVTRSGALFKARALQYCLEEKVNTLDDDDWIVHLDEETLLTHGCVVGILNFITMGKHHFGQGLITYANEQIVNYFLTLCDTYRVADDMGKLRFQLHTFHKPLMGWKGSYVVSKAGAERKVSYDNGPDSSVAEDCYFAVLGASKGYSFGFVEGEMWEKSPFTIMDFLQQRKRWLQGILLVVHSSLIPLKYRLLLATSVYSWVFLPLLVANLFLHPLYPIAVPQVIDVIMSFIGGVSFYMYIYGVFKSFSIHKYGIFKFSLLLLTGIIITPFKVITEVIAVIWGLFTAKHQFYVVKKQAASKMIV